MPGTATASTRSTSALEEVEIEALSRGIDRGILAAAFVLAQLGAAAPGLFLGEPPPLAWLATFDGGGQPFATDGVTDLAVHAASAICVTGFSAATAGHVPRPPTAGASSTAEPAHRLPRARAGLRTAPHFC